MMASPVDEDLAALDSMLAELIGKLENEMGRSADQKEVRRIASAITLLQRTRSLVAGYMTGGRSMAKIDIFRRAASDPRGLSEIGAVVTEQPGPVYDDVERIRKFAARQIANAHS